MVAMLAGLAVGGLLLAGRFTSQYSAGVGHSCLLQHIRSCGFQAILFSLLSRMYAIQEGFIPKTARDRKYGQLITLERGWLSSGNPAGRLDCGPVRRMGMEAARIRLAGNRTDRKNRHSIFRALSLGIEIILFSFLLSTFGLKVRPYAAMVEEIERAHANDAGNAEEIELIP